MCFSFHPQDDYPEDDDDGPYEGDSDAYYILFRKPDELMPPSCVFDKLDRVDADRCVCVCVCD